MTRIWLIRHGSHDLLGKVLTGRLPGVFLNRQGEEEAEILRRGLEDVPLSAIYSSPMERTLQTAGPLAKTRLLEVRCRPEFHEIDFGLWMGRSFDELAGDAGWHEWNRRRGSAPTPGGETMRGVQRRVLRGLSAVAGEHPGEEVAIFSHGDVIRAALVDALGLPLDLVQTLEVGPGGLAVLEMGCRGTQMLGLYPNAALLSENLGRWVTESSPAAEALPVR